MFTNSISKKNLILKIVFSLIAIQVLRIVITQLLFSIIGKSSSNSDLIGVLIMLLFSIAILLISNKKNLSLSVFPNLHSLGQKMGYAVVSLIVFSLIITTPIISGDFSINTLVSLLLSTIATPIFEELIFRGYVWNQLKFCYKNEFTIYIISTLLFALWHLGYVDVIWFKVTLMGNGNNIAFIMLMKVITGLCYGILLGLVRYKLKNCYITMLLHSFMNIFGR